MLVSANAYGKKLFQTVGWLIPYSASIAMYPFFCELVDRENRPELARVVEVSGHVINVFCLPITAVVVALSLPLVTQLYESDAFTPRMCDQAALANAAFTLVLPFYALEYVFMQAFFSNRRMWTPIVLGLVMSALSMLLCYAGAVIFNEPLTGALAALGLVDPGAAGSTAVLVVGLAYTVSRALKVISLGLLMKRFLPDLNGARAVWFACRAALAGLAAGAATYGVRHLYERRVDTAAPEGFMANLPVQGPLLVLGGLAGLGAYLVVLRLVCPAEWAETVHWTRARLAAWRGGGDETPPAAP
jgi:peptidoglycan biosynthesis protein MviN/MurJ (putative lipid II flippase)